MTELDLIVCAIRNIQSSDELSGCRFAALTDAMNVAVLTCDGAGKIVLANKHGLRMFRATETFLKNLYLHDFLMSDGLRLTERLKFQSHDLSVQAVDGLLSDTRGHRSRVSMLLHPLDKTLSKSAGAMIILVPENKCGALRRALGRSETAVDYISYFLSLAQETERKRIASDLHDGLGQVLTMLKFRVEKALIQLAANKEVEAKSILTEVVAQLREAVEDVRRISAELRPSMLDDLGLVPTIRWFCRQFEATHGGITVTLDDKVDEATIPIPIKIPIFRMIQEALNNVAKHAHATSVFIYLRVHHGGFFVEVIDNGLGFDSDRLASGTSCLLGVGINSMRERVEASCGTFGIRSYVGTGTAIRAVWGCEQDEPQWHEGKATESESCYGERKNYELDFAH